MWVSLVDWLAIEEDGSVSYRNERDVRKILPPLPSAAVVAAVPFVGIVVVVVVVAVVVAVDDDASDRVREVIELYATNESSGVLGSGYRCCDCYRVRVMGMLIQLSLQDYCQLERDDRDYCCSRYFHS